MPQLLCRNNGDLMPSIFVKFLQEYGSLTFFLSEFSANESNRDLNQVIANATVLNL
jgi:hypothetical protein